MGMFSYNCRACGHPLLCRNATTKGVNEWMSLGIVIMPNDDVHSGEYDGYGRMGGFDSGDSNSDLSDGSVYHKDCHKALGKPMDFVGKSHHADDQGWFFDDGDHAMLSPLKDATAKASLATVGEIKIADITLKRQAQAKAERAFQQKEDAIRDDKCPHCKFTTAFIVEKGSELMVRCPSRECNRLRPIPPEKQVALRKLFAENPEQHGLWDDDEVNKDLEGVRQAKRAIEHQSKELAVYTGKKGANSEEQKYIDEEVEYLTRKVTEAKQQLQDEEKKLSMLDNKPAIV